MITIELNATVTPEGQVTLQLPSTVPPGEHHLVLVIDESQPAIQPPQPLDLPAHSCGVWPEDLSLRREDMYGDWGR